MALAEFRQGEVVTAGGIASTVGSSSAIANHMGVITRRPAALASEGENAGRVADLKSMTKVTSATLHSIP